MHWVAVWVGRIEAALTGTATLTLATWLRKKYAISPDAALDALGRLSAA